MSNDASEIVNFTPSDGIIATIESELKSFSISNLLEPSDLYDWINYVNHNIGLDANVMARAVMKVKSFRLPVPATMKWIEAIWEVGNLQSRSVLKPGVYLQQEHLYTQQVNENRCVPRCNIEKNVEVSSISIKSYAVVSDTDVQLDLVSSNLRPMILGRGFTSIQTPESVNVNLNDRECGVVTVDPIRKNFHFPFREGWVLLEYWATPLSEESGMPMVIDNPNVLQAIEFYCTYRALRKAYLNGYDDVERRMMMVKAEADTAMQQAQYEMALPSFQTMVKEIQFVRNASRSNDLTSGRNIHTIFH